MASRDEDFETDPTLTEGDDRIWSPSGSAPAREPRDWRSLYEQEHARAERERSRADAAGARAAELRRAEIDFRSRAGSLKWQLDTSRNKLKAAVEETKEVRRAAGDALSLQVEVTRLEKLLSDAGVGSNKHSTIMSLRMEVARLRTALEASEAPTDIPKPLPRTNARLGKALERSQAQNDTIKSLRMQIAELGKEATAQRNAARAAQTSLSRKSARLLKARESAQDQNDTIKSLRTQVRCLDREVARLGRELEEAESLRQTARRLSDEAIELRAELRDLHDQSGTIEALSRQISDLRIVLIESAAEKQWLETQLANRPLLPVAVKRLRAQEKTIQSLSKQNVQLEATAARLQATRAVLSKALFGSRSEQQAKPRSELRRGQQSGAAGHGRTQRPALEERTEEQHPPRGACVCSSCGKPYVANGARSSTVIEIDVQAHTRKIVRPRWRRRCACAASPLEVAAPAPARLFARTPYGTSVWARVLFERYACLRPLHRVSAWLSYQGMAISAGTLADSVQRFVPLFEPVAGTILAHQNQAAVRHGDETPWRIQSLRETGRSSRAWLWTSVSDDAVYFHIDPSRSAEVAKKLFGNAVGTAFLVCDRHAAYQKMARELDGAVILAWCWAHQRRDFIECAAGQARLTRWCEGWIERIASIYRLNETRLAHYDPALERQTQAFAVAQSKLEKAFARLYAHAERELDGLPAEAREAKPLRSLLHHRKGLSVFVDRPQVPMDNNAAERALRGPVIGRRLSFGSDSETGARFTAMMYSVTGSLALNGIDVRRWLEAWLEACAENSRRPPPNLAPWLPWTMSEERRRDFAAPA